MPLCKKHGKEMDTVCQSKPGRGNGPGLSYVGCVDCKAGLPAITPASGPLKTAPPPKSGQKTKAAAKSKPAKKTTGKVDELPPTPKKKVTAAEPPPAKRGGLRGFLGI